MSERQSMTPIYFIGALSLVLDQVTTRIALGLGALEIHPLTLYLIDHRLWLLYDVVNIALVLYLTQYVSRTHSWIIAVPVASFMVRLCIGVANAARLMGVA